MKFKKIITGFLCFISLFVFIFGFSNNLLVNASVMLDYEFTHGYYNPSRDLISVNASTKFFYSSKYNSSDFSLSNTVRLMVGKIGYTSSTDVFRQYIFNFDNYEIKEYNNNIYIYIPAVNYEMGNCTHTVSTDTYSTSTTLSGFTTMGYKALIKINPDFSTIKIGAFDKFLNTVSVDDFIMDDLSGSISYFERLNIYNVFYEYQSTFNIKGETFQNNSDIQNPRYFGITLVDKQKFIDWIIENQKYLQFSDYGISTAVNYVDDIINLYEEFNSSPLKFFTSLPSFIISNGSIFANVDKAKQLYNLIDNLYQEFKISQQQKIFEVGNNNNLLPHQRINPNTDNPIYIEDINDTLDIKLLREILKTLIQTPNLIYDLFDYYLFNISSNVSLIADYIAQIPEYLSTLIYNKFITPINSILDAINNIDISSGGDVTNIENNYITNIVNYLFVPTNTNKFNDFKINFDLKFNWINQIQDYPLKDFDFDTNTNEPITFINMNGMTYNLIDFRVFNDYRPFIHGLIIALSYYRFLSKKFKNLSNIIMARTEEKE